MERKTVKIMMMAAGLGLLAVFGLVGCSGPRWHSDIIPEGTAVTIYEWRG